MHVASMAQPVSQRRDWLLSRTSNVSISGDAESFTSITSLESFVHDLPVRGVGTVVISVKKHGKASGRKSTNELVIDGVLYVPDCPYNILGEPFLHDKIFHLDGHSSYMQDSEGRRLAMLDNEPVVRLRLPGTGPGQSSQPSPTHDFGYIWADSERQRWHDHFLPNASSTSDLKTEPGVSIFHQKATNREPDPSRCEPGIRAQHQSLLFRLPLELRYQIYEFIFRSCTTSHRRTFADGIRGAPVRPEPHNLALLRTCRRISHEIGDTWISQVCFAFEESRTMLDTLTTIPKPTLARISYLSVTGFLLMLSFDDEDDNDYEVFYRVPAALGLLSGLRLERLTVHDQSDSGSPEVTYKTLDDLIVYGNGWKELHFSCENSEMLGYANNPVLESYYLRRPQPSSWQQQLFRRDGNPPRGGPSVKIYRSTQENEKMCLSDPTTWSLVNQNPPQYRQDGQEFGEYEETQLMAPDEVGKAILVVVKRGDGVAFSISENNATGDQDILRDIPGKSWVQIKQDHINCHNSSESDLDEGDIEDNISIVDE